MNCELWNNARIYRCYRISSSNRVAILQDLAKEELLDARPSKGEFTQECRVEWRPRWLLLKLLLLASAARLHEGRWQWVVALLHRVHRIVPLHVHEPHVARLCGVQRLGDGHGRRRRRRRRRRQRPC